VRADAQLSRQDRPVVAERQFDWQGRQRFTSTGTQHGGQETTITPFHITLLHLLKIARFQGAHVAEVAKKQSA